MSEKSQRPVFGERTCFGYLDMSVTDLGPTGGFGPKSTEQHGLDQILQPGDMTPKMKLGHGSFGHLYYLVNYPSWPAWTGDILTFYSGGHSP